MDLGSRTRYNNKATRTGSGDMRLWQIDAGAREAASRALEAGSEPAGEVGEAGHDAGRRRWWKALFEAGGMACEATEQRSSWTTAAAAAMASGRGGMHGVGTARGSGMSQPW